MADDKKYVETTDTGHGYENRQDIYYNDNVGGRAVFVDAKEHDQESEQLRMQLCIQLIQYEQPSLCQCNDNKRQHIEQLLRAV
jgi:hypothetical protein